MDARAGIPSQDTKPGGVVEKDVPPRRRWISISPLNKRRWQNFKANRRGYISFWLFLVLFVVSLFAEFIANDKPFLVKYDGHFYSPALFTYPETTFGGDFETAADYRDPYLQKKIADTPPHPTSSFHSDVDLSPHAGRGEEQRVSRRLHHTSRVSKSMRGSIHV